MESTQKTPKLKIPRYIFSKTKAFFNLLYIKKTKKNKIHKKRAIFEYSKKKTPNQETPIFENAEKRHKKNTN